MKKILFFSIVIFIGLALFVFAFKKVGLENIILAISNFSICNFSIIFFLFLLDLYIGSFRWQIILKSQNLSPIKFSKIFFAKTIGAAINYITPCVFGGGEPFKAYILKKEANIPLCKAVTSIIIEEVIFLSATFAFFILGVVILIGYFDLPLNLIFFLIGTTIICLSILIFFYNRTINEQSDGKGFFIFLIEMFRIDKIKAINKFKINIINAENDISYFFKYKKTAFAKVALLAMIEVLLSILICWLIIIFLGNETDIKQVISINALITAVSLIPIPASLGTLEISQTFIFSLFGLGSNIGMAFSLIFRIANLAVTAMGIIFLVFLEIKIITEEIAKTAETPIQKIIKFFKNLK